MLKMRAMFVGIGILFSLTAGAVDYPADAIAKEGNIFYVKETRQPLTGTLIRNYANGSKLAESVFENGILNGESRGFDPDGKLAHTVEFKNNLKDGVLKQYDENGVVRLEARYKADKLDGETKTYFSTKKIQLIETFQNGVLNGNRTEYYDNGQIKSEMTFVNNKINGVVKEYYANGKIKSELPYINGQKNGKAKSFYENGAPQFEMMFKKDVLHGGNMRFNEHGAMTDKRVYENGLVVNGITTEDGKQRPLTTAEIDELNSKSTLHTPENTYREKDLVYDSKTKKLISGIFRVVRPNGTIQEEYEFWKGRPHGGAQLFDEEGRLTQQTFFENGRKIGYRMLGATGLILKTCRIDEKGVETCE